MKMRLLLVFFLSSLVRVFAGDLIVSAKIVESGFSSQFKSDVYVVDAEIVNGTAETIYLVIMDTNYEASWQVEPKKKWELLWHTASPNYPGKYTLSPNSGLRFRLLVKSAKPKGVGGITKMKLGFCDYRCLATTDAIKDVGGGFYENRSSKPVIWTEEIELPGVGNNIYPDIIEKTRQRNKAPEPVDRVNVSAGK